MRNLFSMLIFVFFVSNGEKAFAQQPGSMQPKSFKSEWLWKQHVYGNERGKSAPFYRSRIFKGAVFTGGAFALIQFVDKRVDQEYGVQQNYKPFGLPETLSDIGEIFDDLGTRKSALALSASALAGGLAFGDKKLRETSGLLIVSLAGTMALTVGGKKLFGRKRPFTDVGPHQFNLFKFSKKHEFQSFPSGHTSSAFAMMTVLAKQYPKLWVKIPAYLMGVSVAMQRIVSRSHWVSDVFVGGGLGYLVSSFAVGYNKKRGNSLTFTPLIGPRRLGVQIGL